MGQGTAQPKEHGVDREEQTAARCLELPTHQKWAFFHAGDRVIHKHMKHFTAVLHHGVPDEGGFWATCLEVLGANGQGETKEEGLADLKEAI